jgi:hypothetical protein
LYSARKSSGLCDSRLGAGKGGVSESDIQNMLMVKIIPYNKNLKALARKLRKDMTFGEVLLWSELKDDKLGDLILTVKDVSIIIL